MNARWTFENKFDTVFEICNEEFKPEGVLWMVFHPLPKLPPMFSEYDLKTIQFSWVCKCIPKMHEYMESRKK